MTDELPSPPEPAAAQPRPRRHRRGLKTGIFFLALLAVLIAVVPHHDGRSTSLPAGRFGATIACLERNALYMVSDAAGALPDAHTRLVQVQRKPGHTDLARLRDAGAAARARTIARARGFGGDATRYLSDGPIVWAFQAGGDPPHLFADAGDRTLIDFCVRTPTRRR
jgi:hypothetical protein